VHHPSSDYPYANLTVDRDGTVYVNTASGSCWHSGEGSFRNTEYKRLGIGDNAAHLYTLGVEIVDKGTSNDSITDAQWKAVDAICVAARKAANWNGWKYRITNHRTWAPNRKIDIDTRYNMDWVKRRAQKAWEKYNG
jgi:N-acetyl-anhydromuramyl-L-alanine amidase AmpD